MYDKNAKIKCVLLAAHRRDSDGLAETEKNRINDGVAKLEELFGSQRFQTGIYPTEELDVRDYTDVDGGNGSGGGAGDQIARPGLSRDEFCFWDFQVYPGKDSGNEGRNNRDVKYPPQLRIELCIRFDSFQDAYSFVNSAHGEPIKHLYSHMLIVPYYEHP